MCYDEDKTGRDTEQIKSPAAAALQSIIFVTKMVEKYRKQQPSFVKRILITAVLPNNPMFN